MSGDGWILVQEVKGGQMVKCRLCGKRVCREFFMAADTNYAEAFRLATAYAWQHQHSDVHRAAVKAFHASPPQEDERLREERETLDRIFGVTTGPTTDLERRKAHARRAAHRAHREAGAPRW